MLFRSRLGWLLLLALAGCGGAAAHRAADEYTGCGGDEQYFLLEDAEPGVQVDAADAPQMIAPADGSAATNDDVIDSYAHGGRLIPAGQQYAGDGSTSPHRDPLVKGFTLSDDERADLKAFLSALTDDELLTNPDFSDPFQ